MFVYFIPSKIYFAYIWDDLSVITPKVQVNYTPLHITEKV